MKLLTLTLRNFMGVKDFTLDTQGGHNVTVLGENGAGKTTLASAWNWMLFDKDSLNRKDFEIKTLTPEGEALHGLEHEVEATIDLDGEQLTLRKVYTEKWTKTRGSAEAVFSGHTTKHYIDGVPVSKRVYDDRIAGIAPEDVFKLQTNPRFFNDSLTWQKRREVLLTVCGDVTDQDVINSDPSLKDLPEILGKRTTEQHRAVIKEQKVKVNKELQSIKDRVSEARHGLPDISQIDPAVLESDLAEAEKMLAEKQAEKLRVEQGGEIAEKQKQLAQIDGEMFRVEGIHRREQEAVTEEARNKLYAVKSARRELEMDIQGAKMQLKEMQRQTSLHERNMDKLRDDWGKVNKETLACEAADTCPTCGQSLPADEVEAARDKAQADFNRNKAERLERIAAEGKVDKAFVEQTAEAIASMNAALEEQKSILTDLLEQEAKLQDEVDSKPPVPVEQNPDWTKLDKQKQQLEATIETLKENNQETIAGINYEIETFRLAVQAYEEAQDKLKAHAQADTRVKELKAEERKLGKEYEVLTRQQDLCDEFTRAKVRMLDDKINSRFKLARFKLFEEQINGGVSECCETLFEGVTWGGGLNNGAQVNCGIDIINTLAEHYGFSAPIFADNAESVTEIIPTPAQLIRLVVSAGDKKLRVEVEA